MDELQTQPIKKERGQALVEYALILVLLAIGFGVAIAATGPAIGNVFSNVVYNVIGADPSEATPLSLIGGNPVSFWQTVTWVAEHPQTETPFPTPVIRPPTEIPAQYQSPTPSLTPTASNTPTLTPSSTPTSSLTPTSTNTPGASPTPVDRAFSLPHVDQMGNPEWWRITGNTPYLGNEWEVTWYDAVSPLNPSTFVLSSPKNSEVITSLNYSGSWANSSGTTGRPANSGITNSDTWGAIFTRTFRLTSPITVIITTMVDDYARVKVNGTTILAAPQGSTASTTYTFNADTDYLLEFEWAENSGAASASITFTATNAPDETVAGCAWQAVNRGEDANSRTWMFAQSATNNVYAANQACYLELRGYVDLSTAGLTPNFILSFWDYWDLPAGMVAELQVSPYVEQVAGASPPVLNRSALSWQTVSVRNGGTANYQWTHNEIDLSTAPTDIGGNQKITFRFVLRNTTGSPVGSSSVNMRWFLDDIQLLNDTRSAEFITVDDSYNLDDLSQRRDFIFNSDSEYTIDANGGQPVQVNETTQYRWNLTNERDGGTDLAWDDSPGSNHATAISDAPSGLRTRVMALEFRPWINLTPGYAPSPDAQGFTGPPILTFWTSYEVGNDVKLEVQYSRAPRHDSGPPADPSNPDGWVTIDQDGLLKNSTACAVGSCLPNERPEANGSAVLNWRQVTVRLSRIPQWDTQPFRLRFAMTIPGNNTRRGWYIDDIAIMRDTDTAYMAYPFFDGAEDTEAATRANWNLSNGSWAVTTERGGHNNTGRAFADSPNGNYAPDIDTTMELRRLIDLNFDTPENINAIGGIGEPAVRPPAAKPRLTFWHLRDIRSGDALHVDLWVSSLNSWTSIWRVSGIDYNYAMSETRSIFQQNAWERVEIDLEAAVLSVTGISNWATLTGNANTQDDDIRIRFRLSSTNSTVASGVYIDDIRIEDYVELTHKLWAGTHATYGPGDGEYMDTIETATRTINSSPNWVNGTDWRLRWHAGGGWTASTAGEEYAHSGSMSLHESIDGNYGPMEEHILELVPIIDLRGTTAANKPRMYFWSRYNIEAGDRIRVQFAVENLSDTTQRHEDLARFNNWIPSRADRWRQNPTPLWQRVESTSVELGSAERRDVWQRHIVNLEPYVGQRIRVRFMLDSDNDNKRSDGWYIDDVQFVHNTANQAISASPIWGVEQSSQPDAWIREGLWGTTQQYFRGSGSTTAELGSGQWVGYFYNCEDHDDALPTNQRCEENGANGRWGTPATYDTILRNNPPPPLPPADINAGGVFGVNLTSDINFWFGTSNRPQNSLGSQASSKYENTYAGRWTRQVSMAAGTYTIQTIANDGVRVRISDRSGLLVNGAPLPQESSQPYGLTNSGMIINRWAASGTPGSSDPNVLDTAFLTVQTSFSNRTMYVEFFEQDDQATITFNASRNATSFTDSPNIPTGTPGGYTTVNSLRYGDSSLLLNGYFNLSGSSGPVLRYYRLWNFVNQQAMYVEYSTNGGFTWTQVDTLKPGTDSNLPPVENWEQRTVNLPANPYVMIRFRMDTYSVGNGNPRDGVYIADITVTAP